MQKFSLTSLGPQMKRRETINFVRQNFIARQGNCRYIVTPDGIAQKRCKAVNSVEEWEVTGSATVYFHKVFNTYVENLMREKYFVEFSACAVHSAVFFSRAC